MTQETTPFLEQQRRVMAQKEQLERDIEQRQRYTLTPGANENKKPYDPKAKYEIITSDATNNKTTVRTITPLPTPQRIQPAKPLTKPELIEMLDVLRDEMTTEQERFDNKDAIDKERTDKRQELHANKYLWGGRENRSWFYCYFGQRHRYHCWLVL